MRKSSARFSFSVRSEERAADSQRGEKSLVGVGQVEALAQVNITVLCHFTQSVPLKPASRRVFAINHDSWSNRESLLDVIFSASTSCVLCVCLCFVVFALSLFVCAVWCCCPWCVCLMLLATTQQWIVGQSTLDSHSVQISCGPKGETCCLIFSFNTNTMCVFCLSLCLSVCLSVCVCLLCCGGVCVWYTGVEMCSGCSVWWCWVCCVACNGDCGVLCGGWCVVCGMGTVCAVCGRGCGVCVCLRRVCVVWRVVCGVRRVHGVRGVIFHKTCFIFF